MCAAKVIVESDVKVGQLIDTVVGVDLPLTDIIFPEKVAVLKVRQQLRQISFAFFTQLATYLLACQPALVVNQQTNNNFVRLWIAKEGTEQPLILMRQLRILRKEQTIHIGRQSHLVVNNRAPHQGSYRSGILSAGSKGIHFREDIVLSRPT